MAIPEFTIEELQNEIWKSVRGYEHVYSISNLGRIRRDLASAGTRSGRMRKLSPNKVGYIEITFRYGGKPKNCKVHRLVAEAFLGACPDGLEVNHKDGCKANNRIANLEYVTPRDNMRHARLNGLLRPVRGLKNGAHTKPENRATGEKSGRRLHPEKYPRGDDHVLTKLKESDIPRIFELKNQGFTQEAIGEIVGIKRSQVGNILRGEARRSNR